LEKFDLVVVLLSQVKKNIETGEDYPAEHTKLKLDGLITAFKKRVVYFMILSGGHNYWVRYDYDNILPKADFSFKAFIKAREEKSEAEVARKYLEERDIPGYVMFLEETSATSLEEAKILQTILERTTFNSVNKIGIFSLAYHLDRVFPGFKETFKESRFQIKPIFAEDFLAMEEGGIERVCEYYSVPKGGKQWPVDKIRKLLENGKSIIELLKN
jgi:hypothetical protein